MSELVLTGLDGSNPLGYLAGVGVLEALATQLDDVRLTWRNVGGWRPVVTGVDSMPALVEAVLDDASGARAEGLLAFRSVKVEKNGPRVVQKFSTSGSVVRRWLRDHVDGGRVGIANDALGLVCPDAFEAEDEKKVPSPEQLAREGIGFDPQIPLHWYAQPTPFDFTSRNAQFLDQLRIIRDGLTAEVIAADITSGLGANAPRIMGWDPLTETPYALFAGASVASRPAAEWLAFRGMCCYPLSADGSRVRMAGMKGRRKAGRFRWCLWTAPLSPQMVRTVVAGPWLGDGSEASRERSARGVAALFEVQLAKDATGYAGVFTPSAPVV